MTSLPIEVSGLEYFSSPTISTDGRMPRSLFSEYARAVVELGMEHCANLVARLAPVSREPARALVGQPVPWSVAWTPTLAELEARLVRDEEPAGVWPTIVQMVLHMAARGRIAKGDIELGTTRVLNWDGFGLAPSDRIAFKVNETSARVTLYREDAPVETTNFTRDGNGRWRSAENQPHPIIWLGSNRLSFSCGLYGANYPLPTSTALMKSFPSDAQDIFNDAAALLADHAPTYLDWIGNCIHTIVPLDCVNGVRISATVEEYPGVVFLTLPASPIEVAARLVHEASHQNYYTLKATCQPP